MNNIFHSSSLFKGNIIIIIVLWLQLRQQSITFIYRQIHRCKIDVKYRCTFHRYFTHLFSLHRFILLNENSTIIAWDRNGSIEYINEIDQFVIEIFVWNHREMFSVKLIRDIIANIFYILLLIFDFEYSQPFSQYSTVIPTFTPCHSCDGTSTPWNRCTIPRKTIHASTNQGKCMCL